MISFLGNNGITISGGEKMGYVYATRKKVQCMDKEKAHTFYDMGYTDDQIADECDVCTETIRVWRRKMGLPKNPEQKKRNVKRKSNLARLAAEAREHGMNYGQYTAMIREGQI